MESSTILQREVAALLLNLNIGVVSTDEDLINTGVMDSLKIVELLMELETHFGIHIGIEELELDNFRSVTAIASFVARHQTAPVISQPSIYAGDGNALSMPTEVEQAR